MADDLTVQGDEDSLLHLLPAIKDEMVSPSFTVVLQIKLRTSTLPTNSRIHDQVRFGPQLIALCKFFLASVPHGVLAAMIWL